MSPRSASAPKRRAQRRLVATGSPVRLATMIVLAATTTAALAAAGHLAVPSSGDAMTAVVTAPAGARQIVCVGHGPSASVRASGVLSATPAQVKVAAQASSLDRRATAEIAPPGLASVVMRTSSANVIAGLVGDTSAAAAGCQEARASWWFTGAGARAAHSSTLVLVNPRPGIAIADVSVWGRRGQIEADDLRGIPVESGAEVVLDLSRSVRAKGDLMVQVNTSRGLVAAGIGETRRTTIAAEPVESWLAPTTPPNRTQRLLGLPPVSGDPKRSVELVLGNPGALGSVATVALIGSGGTFTPEGLDPIRIGAGGVGVLDLSDVALDDVRGVVVTATEPVTATLRSLSKTSVNSTPAVIAASRVGLPLNADAQASLVIASDGQAGSATVRVYDASGAKLADKSVEVREGAAITVELPKGSASVAVGSDLRLLTAAVITVGDSVASSPLTRPEPQRAAIPVRPR